MTIRRKITATAAALGILSGACLATAAPAHAGTSIGTTYNAKTHIWYKYYASTDKFCIMQNEKVNFEATAIFSSSTREISAAKKGVWKCVNVKTAYGFKEGSKQYFTLRMIRHHGVSGPTRPSSGFLRV